MALYRSKSTMIWFVLHGAFNPLGDNFYWIENKINRFYELVIISVYQITLFKLFLKLDIQMKLTLSTRRLLKLPQRYAILNF